MWPIVCRYIAEIFLFVRCVYQSSRNHRSMIHTRFRFISTPNSIESKALEILHAFDANGTKRAPSYEVFEARSRSMDARHILF